MRYGFGFEFGKTYSAGLVVACISAAPAERKSAYYGGFFNVTPQSLNARSGLLIESKSLSLRFCEAAVDRNRDCSISCLAISAIKLFAAIATKRSALTLLFRKLDRTRRCHTSSSGKAGLFSYVAGKNFSSSSRSVGGNRF